MSRRPPAFQSKPQLVGDPPDSNSEKQNPSSNEKRESQKQKTDQQIAYGEVGKLINGAIGIVSRAKAAGKSWFSADCREELKMWAADRGFDYDGESVTKALGIAEAKIRGNPLEQVAKLAKAKAMG